MPFQSIHKRDCDAKNRCGKSALFQFVAFCAVAGIGLSFFELLIAAYPGPWLGGTRSEWVAWWIVAGCYGTLIAVVSAPFALIMNWRWPHRIGGLLWPAIAASILASAIGASSGLTRPILVVAFAALPLVLLAYVAAVHARGLLSITDACAILFLSLVSGVVVARTSTSLQYLLRDTTAFVSWLAVLSAVQTVFMATLLLANVQSRPRWQRQLRTAVAAAMVLLLPVILLVWPHAIRTAPTMVPQQNVLLITADAFRPDYCSTFGGETPTPNLTALASRGHLFETCYATAPWTIPSLNSMFSVKYPPGLSVTGDTTQRSHEQMSYREIASYWLESDGGGSISQFEKLGYKTGAFCGNGAMKDQEWLMKQFDHAIVVNVLETFGSSYLTLNPLVERSIRTFKPDALPMQPRDTTAAARQFAGDFLRVHANSPFFLWIHFLDPHSPFDPPDRFRHGIDPDLDSFVADQESHTYDGPVGRDQARSLYAGEIQYVDEAIGEIMNTVERLGLTDNTVVCFTADHGEELWDRGQIGHGHTMYNEVIRVPLIFAGPHIAAGVTKTPVSTISVMPTLLDCARAEPPESWRGQSIKLALYGQNCPALAQPCFAQATHEFVPITEPKQMVRDGQYKYVRWLATGNRLLFDELADPLEKRNLIDELPEIATRLDGMLDTWEATFPWDFTLLQDQPYRTVKLTGPTVELRENLHALGYL